MGVLNQETYKAFLNQASVNATISEVSDNVVTYRNVANIDTRTDRTNPISVITFSGGSKYVFVFNREEGYIVQLYDDGSLSNDELVKIADNCKVTVTDELEPAYAPDNYVEPDNEILSEQIGSVGETNQVLVFYSDLEEKQAENGAVSSEDAIASVTETITSMTVQDSLNLEQFPAEHFLAALTGESLNSCINEDGSLKPYEAVTYNDSGDITGSQMIETVWLVAQIDVQNENTEAVDYYVPLPTYLEKQDDGTCLLTFNDSYPQDSNYSVLNIDDGPAYLSAKDYTPTDDETAQLAAMHSGYCITLQPGEKLSYTAAYVVRKDMSDMVSLHMQLNDENYNNRYIMNFK